MVRARATPRQAETRTSSSHWTHLEFAAISCQRNMATRPRLSRAHNTNTRDRHAPPRPACESDHASPRVASPTTCSLLLLQPASVADSAVRGRAGRDTMLWDERPGLRAGLASPGGSLLQRLSNMLSPFHYALRFATPPRVPVSFARAAGRE